jgi:hypothetical protein
MSRIIAFFILPIIVYLSVQGASPVHKLSLIIFTPFRGFRSARSAGSGSRLNMLVSWSRIYEWTRNQARATESMYCVGVSMTTAIFILDDTTMTSGFNKRVAREAEGKNGGTTHLAILSFLLFRKANPYSSKC